MVFNGMDKGGTSLDDEDENGFDDDDWPDFKSISIADFGL